MRERGDTTDFGFRDMPLADKQPLVDDVFRSVASRYDLMNDLMSAGLHRAWKDVLVDTVNPPPKGRPGRPDNAADRPFALLDLAGGTGDIALRVVEAGGAGTRATVVDINADMLAVGRARAAERGFDDVVDFVEGNAEALPFPRSQLRRRDHRLRHPQRAAHRGGAGGGLSRAAHGRTLSVPGILHRRRARPRPRSTISIRST